MFMVEFGVVEFLKLSEIGRSHLSFKLSKHMDFFLYSTTPNSTMNISYIMRSPMMSFKEFKTKMEIIDQNFLPK